jgi:branched-chain amino acid transport system permease protein
MMDLPLLGELAINGMLVGLMYGLVALGIVLIYRTSGIANLAQGALAMTGAYVAWAIVAMAGVPQVPALIVAIVAMFGVGMLVERVALRRLTGQPVIMIIMLTIGIEIFLRGLVPGLLGSAAKRFDLGIPSTPIFLGEMLISRVYLVSGGIALALIVIALLLLYSRFGIFLRAVSDDQVASWSVGIRVERAIGFAWGLAAAAATAAGVLWGGSQGVDWTLSLLLMKALAIAILGGLDSILGVLVASIVVGVCEGLASGIFDPIVGGGTRDVVASVIILVTLLIKPEGLFGREHIQRV